jgi:hypothetical protein
MIEDDMTQEERETFEGFVAATDSFMSGWGMAPRKSYVATPYFSYEDMKHVVETLERRPEMKRIRICDRKWRPKLSSLDHLHIYDGHAFRTKEVLR